MKCMNTCLAGAIDFILTVSRIRRQFKSVIEQFDLRESYYASSLRTKELEIMYHTALLEHQKRNQEVESTKSDQLTKQVSTFSQTETELRSQLNIYVEKFKQVRGE